MDSIKILFIGEKDMQLVHALRAMGIQTHYHSGRRHHIWSSERLIETQLTGYYLSDRMKRLIKAAQSDQYTHVVVRVSVPFAQEICDRIAAHLRAKVILDFRRRLTDEEWQPFADRGYQPENLTDRRRGHSALDLLRP